MNKRFEKWVAAVLAAIVAVTIAANVQLVQAEVIVREDSCPSSLGGVVDYDKEQEDKSETPPSTEPETTDELETQKEEVETQAQTDTLVEDNAKEEVHSEIQTEYETESAETENSETQTEHETEGEMESAEGEHSETQTEYETETESQIDEETRIPAEIDVQITDNGILDYRTYIVGNSPKMQLNLKSEGAQTGTDKPIYGISVDNPEVVRLDFMTLMTDSKNASFDKMMGTIGDNAGVIEPGIKYFTEDDEVMFHINRVGTAVFHITGFDGIHEIAPVETMVEIRNSPLHEEDLYIEVSRAGEMLVQKFDYTEWETYLANHKNWVNGTIHIRLSEEGKRYYTKLHTQKEAVVQNPDAPIKQYTLWMENPDKNATTREEEYGTRVFMAGIDRDAPILKTLKTDSRCYEPTQTETQQYYADNFVLQGSFEDMLSGVYKIEYTTDYHAEDSADIQTWQEIYSSNEGAKNADFQIVLSDGCYPAIAVRAYDYAGNVSAVTQYVNDKGEAIKVVVDSAKPCINLNVTAGGLAYNGEKNNWTNQDILFELSFEQDSCPYAGLHQYEYVYEKIGDAINQDSSQEQTKFLQKSTVLKPQNKDTCHLEVQEDRNGYYCFWAVSQSGVRSEQMIKQRVLVQHKAPELKPVIISGVDNTKRKNEWYNKESGTPVITFAYPEYDTGIVSKEYDAPVTIHYKVTMQADKQQEADCISENKAVMGVLSSSDITDSQEGQKQFVLTKEDLKKHVLNFGYDKSTDSAQDGIYTLEYYLVDYAGNQSEKKTHTYKIDSHAPTDLEIVLSGVPFAADSEQSIVYERFYQQDISGSVSVQYGVSGKGSLKILKAKRIGEWDSGTARFDEGEQLQLMANTRCFLYIQAMDYAGNKMECWTRGIVVDNLEPNAGGPELIIEPQGANQHGFFNEDIKVKICVKDAPEDDNCAALLSVKASIGKDNEHREQNSVTDSELFSFTKELPTDEEISEASGFETIQIIDAVANESNNAFIEVTAIDRAQNAKTSMQRLKIDTTKPQISIDFDNNDAANGTYYRQARTATIKIQEQNFDSSLAAVCITRNGEPIKPALSEWIHDGNSHYASILFHEDGDYTIEAGCTDLADNEAEKVFVETFTIDTTAPTVTIALNSEQKNQTDYFGGPVTANITVTEHNFNVDDFLMNILPAASKGAWTHDGDTHTMTVVFNGDNQYHIDCLYTDLAGNIADTQAVSKDFIIDTTAPLIRIAGVEDGSANAGEVVPVITVLDQNIDAQAVNISVKTGLGKDVEHKAQKISIWDENGVGYRFVLQDMNDKPDNIYDLTVTVCDLAGNEAALTYRFSLNRNGSVYDLTGLMKLMENRYNTYAGLDKIQIVEMNVDTVEDFAVYISRNGALDYQAIYTKEVNGSENTGYTYVYTLSPDNFAEEGGYRLSLYSKDRAGNEINNTHTINGDEIAFVIDNTPPRVIIDGVESGMVYDVEEQKAHIVVTDNFALSEAEFMLLNDKNDVVAQWDYMALSQEGQTLEITIPQYHGALALLYRVKDKAGNEIQTFRGEHTALDGFLVTTDKFVQFLNKPAGTVFGRSILAGLTVLGVLAVWSGIVLVRKRKICK